MEQFFELPDGRAVLFNPDSQWHGWLFYRHANGGSLVPFRKLELAPQPYGSAGVPGGPRHHRLCYWDKGMSCNCISIGDCPVVKGARRAAIYHGDVDGDGELS